MDSLGSEALGERRKEASISLFQQRAIKACLTGDKKPLLVPLVKSFGPRFVKFLLKGTMDTENVLKSQGPRIDSLALVLYAKAGELPEEDCAKLRAKILDFAERANG